MDWLKLFRRKPVTTESPSGAPRPSFGLEEVFTPGQPADKGFVDRPQQEADLLNLLTDRGTQILVWGESGAGKSSLVSNVLRKANQPAVTTRCEGTTTYEQIISSAFDKLNAWSRTGRSDQDTRSVTAGSELGGQLSPVTVTAEASMEAARTDEFSRVVPTQLTSEALALRLGEKGMVWVIEDFHKVSPETRDRLSDAMKVFSDESPTYPKLRMIVLGVAETAGDILRTPSNMNGRLADIAIPPLGDEDLGALLDKGKEFLNVDFTSVRSRIVHHSVGVASITHALARECCIALDVRSTSDEPVIVTLEALNHARKTYIRTRGGTMQEDFNIALKQQVTRQYHNYAIILRAIASLPERGATHAEILARIRETFSTYPAGNLTTYLKALQSEERKALIRKTSGGLFRYDRPLQHGYAIMRFGLPAGSDDEFWASDLTVSDDDRLLSQRLATQEMTDPLAERADR